MLIDCQGFEKAFQERGERDHPQQPQPVRRRRHRGGHDGAGSDAGRGDEQPEADQLTTLVRCASVTRA
jgi:hypothetical protein